MKSNIFLLPDRETIDTVFILRRMQDEYHAKGKKLYMCLVDLIKIDRVPRKVLKWALRKKRIQEGLARSMMSRNDGEKNKSQSGL